MPHKHTVLKQLFSFIFRRDNVTFLKSPIAKERFSFVEGDSLMRTVLIHETRSLFFQFASEDYFSKKNGGIYRKFNGSSPLYRTTTRSVELPPVLSILEIYCTPFCTKRCVSYLMYPQGSEC